MVFCAFAPKVAGISAFFVPISIVYLLHVTRQDISTIYYFNRIICLLCIILGYDIVGHSAHNLRYLDFDKRTFEDETVRTLTFLTDAEALE